jgi:hypothetical protein
MSLSDRVCHVPHPHPPVESLKSYIRGILPFSDGELAMLEEMCTCTPVGKGEVLLKEGETANRMYFVEKGLLFGRVNRDGRDVVNWFADEGDFVTLQQELEIFKDYLSLQRIRFEERLDVTFSIDPRTLQLFLPNMMLQT